jgi:hypothetical protein
MFTDQHSKVVGYNYVLVRNCFLINLKVLILLLNALLTC